MPNRSSKKELGLSGIRRLMNACAQLESSMLSIRIYGGHGTRNGNQNWRERTESHGIDEIGFEKKRFIDSFSVEPVFQIIVKGTFIIQLQLIWNFFIPFTVFQMVQIFSRQRQFRIWPAPQLIYDWAFGILSISKEFLVPSRCHTARTLFGYRSLLLFWRLFLYRDVRRKQCMNMIEYELWFLYQT